MRELERTRSSAAHGLDAVKLPFRPHFSGRSTVVTLLVRVGLNNSKSSHGTVKAVDSVSSKQNLKALLYLR